MGDFGGGERREWFPVVVVCFFSFFYSLPIYLNHDKRGTRSPRMKMKSSPPSPFLFPLFSSSLFPLSIQQRALPPPKKPPIHFTLSYLILSHPIPSPHSSDPTNPNPNSVRERTKKAAYPSREPRYPQRDFFEITGKVEERKKREKRAKGVGTFVEKLDVPQEGRGLGKKEGRKGAGGRWSALPSFLFRGGDGGLSIWRLSRSLCVLWKGFRERRGGGLVCLPSL